MIYKKLLNKLSIIYLKKTIIFKKDFIIKTRKNKYILL